MTIENSKLSPSAKPLVIIPAAGYGSGVGSPEAKEMLLNSEGQPLIAYALNQACRRQWPVHVITRKEKKSLIQFLKYFSTQNQTEIQIQIIEPSREWPESVLQSWRAWRDQNLLVLPDSVFEPVEIWDPLIESLKSDADLAMAVFQSQDYAQWGVVRWISADQIEVCEKPRDVRTEMRAWGLAAFTKGAGQPLLDAQLKSTADHSWCSLKIRTRLLELAAFRDLTRA